MAPTMQKPATYADQKTQIHKYIDIRGNTVTYSLEHDFWIVDDGSKFFTVSSSQRSIELTHPVKTIITLR